jgi:hypothetical protein
VSNAHPTKAGRHPPKKPTPLCNFLDFMYAQLYILSVNFDSTLALWGKDRVMTAMQKHAWFTLAVVALSVLTVVVLAPILGVRPAMGGFGLLGLLGFGFVFYCKRPGQVVSDERDAEIQRRSLMITAAVFWVVFVEVGIFLPWAYYGVHGAVPVEVVQWSVAIAWVTVSLIHSVATLFQYGRGGSDAA